MFYAVPTARVIFTVKQVWTFSVLCDRIYEMRCPFVAVGLNALFIVLPYWDNRLVKKRTYFPLEIELTLCLV